MHTHQEVTRMNDSLSFLLIKLQREEEEGGGE